MTQPLTTAGLDISPFIDSIEDYAVFILDPDGLVRTWNRGAMRIKGYQREEILGRSFETFYSEEDLRAGKPAWELVEARRVGRFEDEGWRLRKDGSRFWANVVITAVRDEAGELSGFVKVTRDLTERREREERLREEQAARAAAESERRFRATFELAAVGVAHVGLDGRWLRVNDRLCGMVGYSAEELMARDFQSITHPEDLQEDLDHLTRLLSGATDRYGMQKRYFHRDGRVIWIDLTVSLVRDERGRPSYYIAVIEDVCARKRAEEERERLLVELREALSTRDRFLSIASHELRTPLTALMLQAQMLTRPQADGVELPPRLASRLDSMTRQVRRLAVLVEQLLDVARIHEGRLQLRAEEVELGSLAREVVERFEEQSAQARTPISLEVSGPVTGRWDRSRLDQVLTNLVSNAIKYGGNKPVSLVITGDADRVRVVVADQGIGIREEDRGRLFGRFERLVTDSSIGGLGLGLWITREIVNAFGGTIGVESEPGRGTTFVVELPRQGRAPTGRPAIAA